MTTSTRSWNTAPVRSSQLSLGHCLIHTSQMTWKTLLSCEDYLALGPLLVHNTITVSHILSRCCLYQMLMLFGFFEQSLSFVLIQPPKPPYPAIWDLAQLCWALYTQKAPTINTGPLLSPLGVRQSFQLPLHGVDWNAASAVRQVARNTSLGTHFRITLTSLTAIAAALAETETCKTAFVPSCCLCYSFWEDDHMACSCICKLMT